MKSIPIIFVHNGDSFYLRYALENAKKFNPDSQIILIGDGVTKYPDFVEYYDLNNFNRYSSVLEKIYVHKNNSNPLIELFCIKRWLVLLDFLEKKKLDKVFTCDSDVLLYQDINIDSKNYLAVDVLLAKGVSAGLTFINNIDVLSEYNKIVVDFYKNKLGKVEYEDNNTITDMSFWKVLNKKNKFKVGEITNIVDKSVYDAGILIEQNFIKMIGGMKQIKFINGLPYGITDKNNIRLKCIHFQGPTKFYMKYFSDGKIGAVSKIKIKTMIFLRDKVGPKLPRNVIGYLKRILVFLRF